MAVRVLAVGGVDSSGGAGLFADLRAVEALGACFVSATTALTAQNERGVLSVQPSSLDQFANELRAAFCRRVHAVKTGMLASAAHVGVLCAALDAMGFGGPIVVDPVLAATHGGKLIDAAGIEAMQKALFPRAALITPNLPEAKAFAGCADEPA
ncbi:MAG: bifunctional hydroxymethylpyrimidine kinase/phosphomethylpyrimidine kinase, partial [Zetaproteobacteria bacterium]